MAERDDAFSDVRQYRTAMGGIFEDSDALGELHQAKTTFSPTQTGLLINAVCHNCGMPNGIEADWTELIRIMLKMVPPNWYLDQQHGVVCPRVGCMRCSMMMTVGLNPQECERAVRGGVDAGHVSQGQVQAAIQHLQGMPRPQV